MVGGGGGGGEERERENVCVCNAACDDDDGTRTRRKRRPPLHPLLAKACPMHSLAKVHTLAAGYVPPPSPAPPAPPLLLRSFDRLCWAGVAYFSDDDFGLL